MKLHLPSCALALALFSTCAAQAATEIVPVGYSFDQVTTCGTFCYYDGGSPTSVAGELTDGVLGFEGWGVNSAAPWVGWRDRSAVNIDFSFASAVNIDSVSVGTTQNDVGDVVLPSIDVFAWTGSAWSFVQTLNVPESSANDKPFLSTAPHGFLTLSGLNITASKVRVVARLSLDGPWTFIDEVDFIGSPVPEPATWATSLGGLALLAFAARRRAAKVD